MKIYVVFGETGEYSDRDDWLVKAFINRDKAENLSKLAEEEAKRLEKEYQYYDMPKNANKYDPNFRSDYTGTNYWVEEVELEE